jgi:hypothetical protein
MKCARDFKRYIAKYRKDLKAIHWDDLYIFKMATCKKRFKRHKHPTKFEME